jgi:RNA polymerase sigma factor (sigma-70 family)
MTDAPDERPDAARHEAARHEVVGPTRLEALRQGQGGDFDAAYRALRAELERYARSLAGGRADQADFQPESIVAGALAKGMNAAVTSCNDDGHLAGWLKQAVKHELLDRADRRRPQQMPEGGQTSDPRPFDPADRGAGPSTIVARADDRSGDRAALDRLFRQLDEAAMGESDRQLIDLYVVERLDWDAIAGRLGTTVGAARVAMKRLRDRLLPRIFTPIQARLSPEDWIVAEAMFVRRLSIAELVKESGLEEAAIRRAAVQRIVPAVITEWGGESTELVLRLTGHRR